MEIKKVLKIIQIQIMTQMEYGHQVIQVLKVVDQVLIFLSKIHLLNK